MEKHTLQINRSPYRQERVIITKETFSYSEQDLTISKATDTLSNRERKELQDNSYLFELSKVIDQRAFYFFSRKELLKLDGATITELIRFNRTLDFYLFL